MRKIGANVLVDGVFPEDLNEFETTEPGNQRIVKPAQPVHGKITWEGRPLADARVVFHPLNEKGAALSRAEAVTAANGTFILTTYARNDGAPAGDYAVTVTMSQGNAEDGQPTTTALSVRYAKPETTDLRSTVQEGLNQFSFELMK